jgi:hypothetical protein
MPLTRIIPDSPVLGKRFSGSYCIDMNCIRPANADMTSAFYIYSAISSFAARAVIPTMRSSGLRHLRLMGNDVKACSCSKCSRDKRMCFTVSHPPYPSPDSQAVGYRIARGRKFGCYHAPESMGSGGQDGEDCSLIHSRWKADENHEIEWERARTNLDRNTVYLALSNVRTST